MKMSAAEITQVRNAVVLNIFPSKDIKLGGTVFQATFSPSLIPTAPDEVLSFFESLINIRGESGTNFLRELPVPLFMALFVEYFEFHHYHSIRLAELVLPYSETVESMNTWDVFKGAGPEYVLTLSGKQLNPLQYLWVLHNTRRDTQGKYALINSVIEVLKPWLSPELYSKVKENEGAQRENWMYDDPDLDARLQKQADTILKEKAALDDDLDIIEIEDSTNG